MLLCVFQILMRAFIILNFTAVQRRVLVWIRLCFNCYRLITSMDYILAYVRPKVQSEYGDSRAIPRESGGERKRERDKQKAEGEERGERNQWHLFFLLIASCFLLRTAGEVSARAWTEISLLSLSCLSALCLDSSFYFSPFWMSFICRVMIAGKAEDQRREAVINKTVC